MAKIIVIGRNYTSRLGMIRAVGSAEHDVIVINTGRGKKKKDIDGYSKYVKKYLFAAEPDRKLLVNTIMSEKAENEKVVIIPVDDYAASTIDEYIDVLKQDFVFPNINMQAGAVTHLMDKDVQKDLARKAGLPVAEGWVMNITNGHYTIPEDIKYPCFPKPQVSFTGSKSCMKRCNNQQELEEVVQILVRQFPNCSLLIEQYIEIEKEYGVLGLCTNNKIAIPGLVDKVEVGNGAHKGVTKVGIVTPLKCKKELQEKLHIFLASTGFNGLCDIDLYENNGQIYFNELNLRFGAFGYSIYCAGANLPEILVKSLCGEYVDLQSVAVEEKTICLSEKVNFEDFLGGFYGLRTYLKINAMADKYFLKDENDNRPYSAFRKKMIVSYLKSLIKRMMGRL